MRNRLYVPISSLGYWNAILAGVAWRPYTLEFYRAHGYLEFNIKGAAGGEQFNLILSDYLPSRLSNTQLATAALSSAVYVTTTTSWQHVRIPLSAFVAPDGFDFRQVRSMELSNASSGTYVQQFWLNSIEFTSPDTEPSYPAIKVNQLGYTTHAWKYATISGFGELLTAAPGTPFEVLNASTSQAAYTGQLTLVTNYDVGVSGEKVLNADFTALTTPGTYYIHVEATRIADSLQFTIGDSVLQPLQRAIQRYYFYQRQGIAIGAQYADPGYARGLGHPNDVTAQFRSHSSPTIDVSHGWYDAGDYGKYTNNTALTSAGLLDAYSIAPAFFNSLQVNIPESGNGMPDLLNEVKWELDFLMKMQDPASGGFYVQATSTGCMPDGDCKPEDITLTRYVEDLISGVPNVRPTAPSALAVAALARAAGIYSALDASLAQSYLAAAEAGWAYLQANPANIEATGFAGDQLTDDQERMWAAAELFRTTGEAQYNTYFLANYQNYAAHFSNTTGSASDIIFRAFNAYNGSAGADATERAWFTTNFAIWRGIQLKRMEGAWRNFMPLWGYYWSSNSETLTTILVLAQGEMGTTAPAAGDIGEIVDAAQAQINYILGVNPLHRSYVSGIGGDTIQTVYSSIYPAYGLYTPPPGYMPGGPDIDDSPWYSQFPARCYADTDTDWPVSEHDIGYTAPLVFTAAYLAQNSSATTGPAAATPTVTVSPSTSSVTTAQSLSVTVTVTGGTATPTGSVTLSGGGYTSAAATLSGGSVTINIPAGSLAVGSDTLTASYTPDANSSSTYNGATGVSSAVTVEVPNPAPVISSLSTAFTSAGGAAFTLTVNGTSFTANSTVNWGATALTTTYVSASKLTAAVSALEIASAGTSPVTVVTPAPGGGTSNTLIFEIDSADSTSTPPSFSVATVAVAAGSPASYTVTLPSSVTAATVSCLNLPAGASCSYSAGTVTITTSATTPNGTYQIIVVFTETVTESTSAWILMPILLLPLYFARKRLTTRGSWLSACVVLVVIAAVTVIGCGGGGSSTNNQQPPPQTYQVVSSGTVTLTVQ